MLFVREGATHKVVLGPAVAVGDGFTPVTTLALSTADEAEVILHDNGTVVDISGYTWAAITTADGYYHLTLQTGITNTIGHMTVVVNDDSLILPLRADFTILPTEIYDALFASDADGFDASGRVAVGSWLAQAVTLSTNNKPDVNVDEWNDVALATTNPLPNAAAEAAGGLYTRGTGAGQINQPADGQIDGNVVAMAASVLTQAAIAADVFLTLAGVLRAENTAQAGAAGTITLDASAGATDETYTGGVIVLTGGTGAGQGRRITAYNGTTKVATVDRNWATNPDATTTFVIYGSGELMRGTDSAALATNYNATRAGYLDNLSAGAVAQEATVAALNDLSAAQVNAEVVDAVNVDTYAEPSGVFAWPATITGLLRWLGGLSRNKVTQTATTQTLRNDADSANLATSTVSDDGTTATRGEWV